MALLILVSPALAGVAALVVALTITKIVHLLYFHPLAKYPGPLLGKLTPLYAAYHGWRGDIHLDMWRCHQQYGDCVRYKPNSLLINTAEGLKEIYGLSSGAKYIKSKGYAPMVHRAPNTLTIRGGKDHARRRRIMAQGVSEKAQRGYEGRVMAHIDQFCAEAYSAPAFEAPSDAPSETEPGRCWSEPLDMARWTNYLSFDIMADVVFGAQYNLIGNARFRYVVESIDKSNVRMGALVQAPSMTAFKLDKYLFRDAIRSRNRFVKFVLRVVKERLDKTSPSAATALSTDSVSDHDLFANLAAAKDPETGSGFGTDEIAAESATLIVAGSDTSSTAIASVLFYLAHNPTSYAKAAAEVRAAFASRQDIKMGAALASCKYLRACIDEALRMSPPVGSALWREAVAPGGAVIDGRRVPQGTDVGVSIYALHHSGAAFADPFAYRPERWLGDDGSGDSVERARAAYAPFSVGTRGCLGKGLAQTEMMLTFTAVLFAGDFKLPEDGPYAKVGCGRPGEEWGRHRQGEFQLSDHVTSQKKGPFLCFSPRADAS